MPDPAPFIRGTSRFGIDVGGVLTTDTDNSGAAGGGGLAVAMQGKPPSPECVAAVKALVQHFGPENVFILSKCSTKIQQATACWLGANRFFARTGLRPAHVRFCANRSGTDGTGPELQWAPLPPPPPGVLSSLAAAAGRPASEVTGYFGPDGAAVATPAALNPAAPVGRDGPGCGKGVVARELRLTHFIDDRAECLHSVFFEGHLGTPAGGGLAAAAAHGCMLHFGADARQKRIAQKGASDTDLIKLVGDTRQQSKPSSKLAPADPEELVAGLEPATQEVFAEWQALEAERPTPPKGAKPPPEMLVQIKAASGQMKKLEAALPKNFVKLYGKAAKAAAITPRTAAKQDANTAAQEAEAAAKAAAKAAAMATKWTCPDALSHWGSRLAADRVCTSWAEVLQLFGLELTPAMLAAAAAGGGGLATAAAAASGGGSAFEAGLVEAEGGLAALQAKLTQLQARRAGTGGPSSGEALELLDALKALRPTLALNTVAAVAVEAEHAALTAAVEAVEDENRKLKC